MRKVWLAGFGLAVTSAALWFLAHSASVPAAGANASPSTRTVLYYRDPMHPSYRSDKPGKAPDCGMPLEPVYAIEGDGVRVDPRGQAGMVQVSRNQQQVIGVRLGRVERSRTALTFRTFGRVIVDDNHVFPVSAGGEGWVVSTFPGTATGNTVERGQPLAVVYGRDFTTAQRTFLYALRASENPPPVGGGAIQDQITLSLQEATLALRNLGFGQALIEQLTKTRQVVPEVTLVAPGTGVIVARNIFPNQKFEHGLELFRIVDLSHVAVIADIFGDEESYIVSGASAILSVTNGPTNKFRATVANTLPRFDGGSRTLKVRLNVENPQLILRPDMLVDLEFPVRLPEATTVPAEAVVESGLSKIVFVDRGEGAFEPREVETGWHLGGRVQIVTGLSPGESIVVSGNFLLDSERSLRSEVSRGHD